jgi:hypothetical protein
LSREKRKILKNVFSLQNINPKDWPRGNKQNPTKTALAVFYVGIATPRLNQKHCADLVTLSKRGLYPLWLHTTVISARVEVLLFEIAHCLWICSSFYSNF